MNFLHKLQDPHLVAAFQRYFGVQHRHEQETKEYKGTTNTQYKGRTYEEEKNKYYGEKMTYEEEKKYYKENRMMTERLLDDYGAKQLPQYRGQVKVKVKGKAGHVRQGSAASVTSLSSDGEGTGNDLLFEVMMIIRTWFISLCLEIMMIIDVIVIISVLFGNNDDDD